MDVCCLQPWLWCHLPAQEVRDAERELLTRTQVLFRWWHKTGGCRFESSQSRGWAVTTHAANYRRMEGDLENAPCSRWGLVRLL